MKKSLRIFLGFLIVSPFLVPTKILSIFIGQEKAIKTIGPLATYTAKQALKLWVPKIEKPEDFASFAIKMKKNFWLWKTFYDIEISSENSDVFKLYLSNCPFCEVLDTFGLSNLSPYICEGDWAIANDNKEKWLFERSHQIGTGDKFCDHTYKRKKRVQQVNKH